MNKNQTQKTDFKTVLLFCRIVRVLKPKPNMHVSDWADHNRYLSMESSTAAGRWRTSEAPFQREIMNAVNDVEIVDIIIMSSSQVGKTEILLNIFGYYADYDPAQILFLQPTILMAEDFSKDRLAPMIRDTPVLKSKIKNAKSRDSDNTILHKRFPGGYIALAGSNSPASLASRPIRILLCDEIDRYPASSGTEGDPVKLAERRTQNFWNRKKIKVSTPTIKGISKIEKEFLRGTQEEWSVQCPCCGTWQEYNFDRIRFSDVTMGCVECGEHLTEQEWKESPHQWIAKKPERKKRGIRSFHLNALASPWIHWEEIIQNFLDANEEYKRTGSTSELITFVNTVLGRCWEERGDGADDNELLERRIDYQTELPEGVLLLTAGADVQDNRLEVEVVGWGKNNVSYGIYKTVFYGDPSQEEIWEQLEEYLTQRTFSYADGNELHISGSCIDTGGHHTSMVYKFVKKMAAKGKKIYGVKGYANTPGIPLIYKKTRGRIKNEKGQVIDTTEIFILGVDAGKEDIISRLKIKDPNNGGYCFFPKDTINGKSRGYDKDYFKGLTSEEKITEVKKGRVRIKWVKKPGIRNEPLDLRNYAYAAEQILRPNYDALEEKIKKGIDYTVAKPKTKRRRGTTSKGIQV